MSYPARAEGLVNMDMPKNKPTELNWLSDKVYSCNTWTNPASTERIACNTETVKRGGMYIKKCWKVWTHWICIYVDNKFIFSASLPSKLTFFYSWKYERLIFLKEFPHVVFWIGRIQPHQHKKNIYLAHRTPITSAPQKPKTVLHLFSLFQL